MPLGGAYVSKGGRANYRRGLSLPDNIFEGKKMEKNNKEFNKMGIIDTISRLEYIILYKTNYLSTEQRKNWEKALKLLYKAYRLLTTD